MRPRVGLFLLLASQFVFAGSAAAERLLVPIFYNGAGADGTHWRSEYTRWNPMHGIVRELDFGQWPGGVFIEASSDIPRFVHVNETSSLAPAAIVPVVPISDFATVAWVPSLPTGPGRRVTLRVYSLQPAEVTIGVGGDLRSINTRRGGADEPAYAVLDLSELPPGEHDAFVRSGQTLVWAMGSSFDLVTRELTVRTPP